MILDLAIAALCDLVRAVNAVGRIYEFTAEVAISAVTDVRTHARRAVLRRIDHLLHGAPCPCCEHSDQETDR